MRILGFSKMWSKLQQDEFTTFRFPRKDRDWGLGEVVQIVYKPRSKNREMLGVARITSKQLRNPYDGYYNKYIRPITYREAVKDGFQNWEEMRAWLIQAHGLRITLPSAFEPMNKLTLRWV